MINTDPQHVHTYDSEGRMTCCSLEEKVYANAGATELLSSHEEHDDHHHDHDHGPEGQARFQYVYLSSSFILLVLGIIFDHLVHPAFFKGFFRLGWYLLAYVPVGVPVMKDAFKAMTEDEIFTEFTLMSIATIGAFAIKQYPEAVAVMLFYSLGELFQSAAVNKAKRSVKALLDVRPNRATVLRGEKSFVVDPRAILINEIIEVKSGEKVALDGVLLNGSGSFNAAALTGESVPKTIHKDEAVLAGMINAGNAVEVKVNRPFDETAISKILDLVQNATTKKAKTELFIRKFSKIYTPAVVFLAVGIMVIPYFIFENYFFSEWLYKALIFLVVSCPCALVISIPLGYFGGIGAASRNGILFKGSNYLDLLTKVDTMVMDKTGTLTKGVFKVQEVRPETLSEHEFLTIVSALEKKSTHPIAKAIVEFSGENRGREEVEEIPGYGMKGVVNGKTVLAGNKQLFEKFSISFPNEMESIVETVVLVAIDSVYAGYIIIADEIKDDAAVAVHELHQMNIETIMLSGDKQSMVNKIAGLLKIDKAFGNLLPGDKIDKVGEIKKEKEKTVAFAGDGINDAPVLAMSNVGIAMGGLGSDAAIEAADVVIQSDQPSKIVTAIKIAKATKAIVWQNISFAFGVKLLVLSLGAGGLATMWEAVFADVGVALLAVLNAVRIQRKKF